VAIILDTDIASAGAASVSVVNPGPGGGTSNALPFTIEDPSVISRRAFLPLLVR
jgi:hypothetical protein